jgi:8-oxo-dGTP pyrophosphatase MutT (NUDIX family)
MIRKFINSLLERFGVLEPIKQENQPCYDKYGRFIGWYSRSIAVALFIFCKDKDGEWCVLGSERGKDAADFQGYWNCVCGYLEFGDSLKHAAQRECNEELGLWLNQDDFVFVGYNDSPKENRQNVTMRYAYADHEHVTTDFTFSKKLNEGNEVGEIAWIRLQDIDKYKWAFNHDKRIVEIFANLKKHELI